jgi:TATA-binding protein-associated factor
VNRENTSLEFLDTNQLLDLFQYQKQSSKISNRNGRDLDEFGNVEIQGEVSPGGLKGILQSLGELWDENEYNEEYNLDNFLKTLQ